MIYASLLIAFLGLLIINMHSYFSYRSLQNEFMSFSTQIETMLDNKSFSYITCSSGDQAVQKLARDINDLVSAYQNQDIANRRKNREILRVMTNVSHDLRTPLTILFGYVEMLVHHIREETVSLETQNLAQKLYKKTQTANRMISQLLDMSRINSGDYPMNLQDISLTKLSHKIILDYYDRLEQLGFRVDIQPSDQEIILALDRESAIRILRNLIENVIAHASDGKYIGLRIVDNDHDVAVHILDHGKGIPDYERTNIFKRGILLPGSDSNDQSHGLGLSIAWSLAKMMGGDLYLAESSDHGSDFCWMVRKVRNK